MRKLIKEEVIPTMFELGGNLKLWKRVYYPCYRGLGSIKYFFKKVKERLVTGFPHEQSWEFRSWHAKIVVPRLKHLRDNHFGHPGNTTDDGWVDVLNKMIWSFENIENDPGPTRPENYDPSQIKRTYDNGFTSYESLDKRKWDFTASLAHNDRVQEGLLLFAEYYQNLWD